jgi:RES domain-containing protein
VKIYRMHGVSVAVFDTGGAVFREGRWHLRGTRIVYAAQHVSLAALETLVHANSLVLPPKVVTEIDVPDSVAVETAAWMQMPESQVFGSRWADEARTAVLAAPSIVVQGMEWNYVLNPAHPEFGRITHGAAHPFVFDGRLFAGPAAGRER